MTIGGVPPLINKPLPQKSEATWTMPRQWLGISGLVWVAWAFLVWCGLIFVPRIEWSPTHLVAPWMPCFCPPGHALELPRFAEGSKAKTETAHWTAEVGQLVQFSVYCRLKSSMNWQAQQFSKMLCWLVVKQPLWKIWVHELGWLLFPIYGKIKMVQTTNQYEMLPTTLGMNQHHPKSRFMQMVGSASCWNDPI